MLTILTCCGLLFVCYAALITRYAWSWAKIPEYAVDGGSAGKSDGAAADSTLATRISVLVPARNEEAEIAACLDSLAAQRYPREQYEIIVIDDHSTDRTAEIVRDYKCPGVAILCLKLGDAEGGDGGADAKVGGGGAQKKRAIEAGVAAATGTLIVTTDADCRPGVDWLRTLAGFHTQTGAKCIAAPVKIEGGRGWLSVFEKLDFITLQGITGAAVDGGLHSLGNGANLAYEKEAFLAVEGYKDVDHIPSGDDLFLMYKIARRFPGSVKYIKSREATVATKAAGSWRAFLNQRIRWASKADRYEERRIFWILLLVYLVNAMMLLLLVAAIWLDGGYGWALLVMLAAKILVEMPFVGSVAGFFGQRKLMIWFPLLQPVHIIYTLVIGWLGKFGSYRWKGRKLSS